MLLNVIKYLIIGVMLGGLLAIAVTAYNIAPRTKRIDCSLSEFHPDFTPEMREQCRLLRSNRIV